MKEITFNVQMEPIPNRFGPSGRFLSGKVFDSIRYHKIKPKIEAQKLFVHIPDNEQNLWDLKLGSVAAVIKEIDKYHIAKVSFLDCRPSQRLANYIGIEPEDKYPDIEKKFKEKCYIDWVVSGVASETMYDGINDVMGYMIYDRETHMPFYADGEAINQK